MSSRMKTLALWLVIILVVALLYRVFINNEEPKERLDYTEFMKRVEDGRILSVKITGTSAEGEYRVATADGGYRSFTSSVPSNDDELYPTLRAHNVKTTIADANQDSWLQILIGWAPMILLIGIWIFFMRQMQSGGNRAISFGKSRAKLHGQNGKKITFRDVAGIEEAKDELSEIIDFLKDPQRFQRLGGRIPKGVLVVGPPGTGKTLLARAIAGEANVPFFSISGSDFVEMFVGVGASRVRDLFEQGKKNAPCLIFIDEIDAVGRHRGAGLGGGHDEREQTLNALLVEMDGFESNEGIIVIAATNRPDVLDPALLRPGRFDRQVVVDRPDIRGRAEILRVHTRNLPLSKDVELEVIARGTPGFTGADLENLANEAAIYAARRNKSAVEMSDFEEAKDKVLMGAERRSLILSEEEKRNTAYHEAGHAMVALALEYTDPVHKVTIIPRGRALGLTQTLPVDDKHTYTKAFLEDQLAYSMGGRAAEEIFLNHLTTGAGNDIERATELARKMVCEWGMSEKLGPLSFGKQEEHIFLGREIAQAHDMSQKTWEIIDSEIKVMVMQSYKRARKVIEENKDKVELIAVTLLEREVLEGSEIERLLEGGKLPERAPRRSPAEEAEGSGGSPVGDTIGGPEPEPSPSGG
jgi:cell division protease FtsH